MAISAPGTLPAVIKPMLAGLVRRPFDSPDHIFELKWDGARTLAFIENGEVRLQSRNLKNVTAQYPELRDLARQVKADKVVLDGELVCLDEEGRPSFQRLQERVQRSPRSLRRLRKQFPVHYIVFDILFLNGRSVMEEPLWKRKNLLHEILVPSDLVQPCEFIENDGMAFFQATCEHGLEGIMAKEKGSFYLPGRRSSSWLKIKRLRESDFVIGGYTFGGTRELFSSLLLGLYEAEDLLFVGLVGTGFSESDFEKIYALLQPLHTSTCPFKDPPVIHRFIYWCRPELVCRVSYGEFTLDRKLRYPVFLGLREDKLPTDCVVSDAPGWPQTPMPEEED